MRLVKITARAAVAAALSVSALGLGAGAATALADTGFHQDRCFGHFCGRDGDGRHDRRDDFRFDDRRWDQRGFDDGRRDHRPFNYRGFRADPFFDRGRGIWGFWFLGVFIPL
ncbi:hypothetical protein H7K45_02175 [Mycobacterium yunnanensis]|uniref:Uncharacterized protein n=1 Tax=Mycobacterium yunnanensis TaxID=368477 RepID=A0A9X2YHG6_9MYCO|nr:hypothetical protein [Mycobacterium yunnanensis]MCV7419337.1 hypothetical protein [Mycobacterium yunnanensis]